MNRNIHSFTEIQHISLSYTFGTFSVSLTSFKSQRSVNEFSISLQASLMDTHTHNFISRHFRIMHHGHHSNCLHLAFTRPNSTSSLDTQKSSQHAMVSTLLRNNKEPLVFYLVVLELEFNPSCNAFCQFRGFSPR